MRSALIVATVLCGLGFGATNASARPVHHRTTVTNVAAKHAHKKHGKTHSKHRSTRHHHNHK
jgi:hypothetical protein